MARENSTIRYAVRADSISRLVLPNYLFFYSFLFFIGMSSVEISVFITFLDLIFFVIFRVNEDVKLSDLELGKLANNIQELLYSASDICHDRAVKFLMSRAKVIC